MGPVARFLYGKFPRRVGNPVQWPVHSPSEFSRFVKECEGERNLYSTISHFDMETGAVISDKISIDLDSPMKDAAFPTTDRDDEKVMLMREDHSRAEEALGPVCEDARKVARLADDEDVPLIGVFSGFGLHIHMLYQETPNASDELATTVRRYNDLLDLDTLDVQLIGDVQRILRVPNVRRVYVDAGRGESITSDTHTMPCNLYTVPITHDEMKDISVSELLSWSTEPRSIPLPDGERPEMRFYEDYDEVRAQVAGRVETEINVDDYDRQGLLNMLKDLLSMPCMYERIVQPNPHHKVRMNCAVLLFNCGFSVEEVEEIFMKLNWKDKSRKKTRKYLKQIYRRGYSDMSCETIQQLGLCQRADDPGSCETYGWNGGTAEWVN
jgi:hypothetical protein